jgi:hypothetical protein
MGFESCWLSGISVRNLYILVITKCYVWNMNLRYNFEEIEEKGRKTEIL